MGIDFESGDVTPVILEKGTMADSEAYGKNTLFIGDDGNCYIRNFHDLKVSTMTLVALFNGLVSDLGSIFYLLPCTHRSISGLRHPAGTITSIRWNDMVRGEDGSCFKNVVIFNIWTKAKKVSCKLAPMKIQMTGTPSIQMGEEASEYLLKHVNHAIDFIEMIKAEPDIYMEAMEWLLKACRGETISTYQIVGSLQDLNVYDLVDDMTILWPCKDGIPHKYSRFVEEMMNRCQDYNYISELTGVIGYFSRLVSSEVSSRLTLRKVGRSMVNYNYDLGFCIDRRVLYDILRDNYKHANFPNTLRHSVEFIMYSTVPDDDLVIRRDSTHSKQTFLIHLAGNVMHSGPGGSAMEECYYRFMSIIARIKHFIVNTNIPKRVKSSRKARSNDHTAEEWCCITV